MRRYRQRAARPLPHVARDAGTSGCVLLEGNDIVRSYEAAATGLAGCLASRDGGAPSLRRHGSPPREKAVLCGTACDEAAPTARKSRWT